MVDGHVSSPLFFFFSFSFRFLFFLFSMRFEIGLGLGRNWDEERSSGSLVNEIVGGDDGKKQTYQTLLDRTALTAKYTTKLQTRIILIFSGSESDSSSVGWCIRISVHPLQSQTRREELCCDGSALVGALSSLFSLILSTPAAADSVIPLANRLICFFFFLIDLLNCLS
jgi:hypothetical protein